MIKEKFLKVLQMSLSAILIVVMVALSLPYDTYFENAKAAETPSQTKDDITTFQKNRWSSIQSEVFGQNFKDVQDASELHSLSVKKGNSYFNWTDTSNMQGYDNDGNKIEGGLQKYSGTPKTVVSSGNVSKSYADSYVNYQDKTIEVKSSVTFTVYDIYTADQLAWVLRQPKQGGSAIKVNICADIDMGGSNNLEYSTNQNLRSTLYIEGNGHTIYNLKMYGTTEHFGLYNELDYNAKFVVNNLGFQSIMLLHQHERNDEPTAGLLFGYAYPRPTRSVNSLSLDNVHITKSLFQQSSEYGNASNQGLGFLGGKGFYEKMFVNNCSSGDSYIYGTGHVGGIFSLTDTNPNINAQVKYNFEYPNNQIAFALASENVFPCTFHNTYSVDCEMFSTGMDSGAFVSCARGIVAINCFTNNIMYSNQNTGGFIGRVNRDSLGGNTLYDITGKTRNIGSVFRNCYSAGTVEGKVAMGGFVGYDSNYRTYNGTEVNGTAGNLNYKATTVYENCYSTTMVGMDYTGKYCGGFIGFDENYSNNSVTVQAPDGKILSNIYGNVYMNCYAAGEVGNILTWSDTTKSVAKDNAFFSSRCDVSVNNLADYYPSGGFVGALSIDAYYKANSTLATTYKQKTYDYFYNCYYDKQTTAMKEMAIGLAYAETCRDDTTGNNKRVGLNSSSKVVHRDSNGDEIPFSVIGITGVYTEKSDTKKVAGLTSKPTEYKDSAGNVLSRMSMSSENSVDTENNSTWAYNEGYYPQLKVFMSSDVSKQNISNATVGDITNEMKNSEFFVDETEDVLNSSGCITHSETHPVLSRYKTSEKIYENYTPNKNPYASQIVGVITPFRYSQASTATVFLNHWDYKMNTYDGSLSTDNDWACGVKDNKLTYNEQTGYFENTYKSLAAGKYEFKVQANSSMAYNYGSNRFDGQNCILNIPVENCNAKIMFKYNGIRSNNYQIFVVLSDSNGNPIDENGELTFDKKGNPIEKKILLGGTDIQVTSEVWTLVGMLPNSTWNVTDENYDLSMSPTDSSIYNYTCNFTPDKDESGNYKETECQFKIAKDHAWTESYGIAGKSDNMSFKYNAPCTVKFEFNSKTHITKVTAISGSIYKVFTERATEYEFKGLSVIGQQALTGYNWLESGKELEAAKAGQLKKTSTDSNVYQVSFNNVKMGTDYAYKIIENAVDSGANSYFSIKSHPTDVNGTCTVTFTYDKNTKETTVSAKIPNDSTEYASSTVDVSSLSVIGSEDLTGYFWLGDKDHPQDQSDESKQHYKDEAVAAGLMEKVSGSDYLYQKTFYDRPAGTYAFKVGANGSLDMSWGESGSNDNYTFTLTKKADVTVTFNQKKQMISVATEPTDALDIKQYVVTGTENLMGKTWDLNDAIMTYNDDEGVYEYTKTNVKSGQNYSFKVIEKGVDSGSNISFSLASIDSVYDIKFIYDPKTQVVTEKVYTTDTSEDVTASVLKPVQVTSYSVLGDKGLTGYNWLGLTDKGTPGTEQDQQDASLAGLMTSNEDGTYSKVYTGIDVGTNGDIKSYPFKIAANGNWDSGISYGDDNGDNYMLVLNGDGSGVDKCDVTITFNPKTKKITVETNPSDCNMSNIDDSSFTWYVVGDAKLVSYDSFKAPTSVYDTVRDITSNFTFTSGNDTDERGLAWSINKDRNKSSEFIDNMGGDGFTMDYDVDGKTSTGTFNAPVVDLKLNITTDHNNNTISNYSCDAFAPGKQWLSISTYGEGASDLYLQWQKDHKKYEEYEDAVKAFDKSAKIYYKVLSTVLNGSTTENLVNYLESLKNSSDKSERSYYKDLVDDYGDILALYEPIRTKVDDPGMKPEESSRMIIGSRNIRLIPTVYMEAGNDADIAVYQSDNAKDVSKNVVTYEKNSSPNVTFTEINDVGYSYYNFAFTSAYAITDKVGLGIYSNYVNQDKDDGTHGIIGYDSTKTRDQNDTTKRVNDTYFAMKSAFAEKSSYTDKAEHNGLSVDTLVKQSLIGSSYEYSEDVTDDDGNKKTNNYFGQTIVKIYKVNDNGINSKVTVDSSANKTTEEYQNYLKWTGQSKFTSADKGNYKVTFYWTLSDGRYLSDTKLVTINVLQPGISKSVDLSYAEAGSNTLVYNVTYTNSDFASPVTFGVLDILPFKGDTRIGYGVNNGGTKGSDVTFNLKSIKVKQSGVGTIKGVYYSQNKEVRNYLTDSEGKPVSDAAKNLDIDETGKIVDNNNFWTDLSRTRGGGGTFITDDADNATAVAISGIQLGVAESITVTITVEYTGNQNDIYVNNAFYRAYDQNKSADICSNSKPVSTNIVGRDINGYVWLDSNINGVIDSNETRFADVTVSLYRADDTTGEFINTGLTTKTDEQGYYSYKNLSYGEYKVVINKSDNPKLKTKSGDSYLFEKFDQTKKLLEAKADGAVGSRNLSLAEKNSSGSISSYYVTTKMPTAVEIYRRSYTNNINAKCDDYNYTKSYLNIGLATEKCSITIVKKGQDGNLLNGTSFQLEKYYSDEDKWVVVKFNESGYIYSDDFDEDTAITKFTTGDKMPDGTQEQGKVHISNLPSGKYRISEVGASKDYVPLMVNFEVELPYKVKTSDIESYTDDPILNPSNVKTPDYTDGDYSCYRNVTFVVKNAKDINRFLPLTGSDSLLPYFILGAILILLGLALILYLTKKNKKKDSEKNKYLNG